MKRFILISLIIIVFAGPAWGEDEKIVFVGTPEKQFFINAKEFKIEPAIFRDPEDEKLTWEELSKKQTIKIIEKNNKFYQQYTTGPTSELLRQEAVDYVIFTQTYEEKNSKINHQFINTLRIDKKSGITRFINFSYGTNGGYLEMGSGTYLPAN